MIRPAEALAGLAAVALLLAMALLDWYAFLGAALNAWRAFGVLDVVLLVPAALGLALPALTATRRSPALPVAMAVLLVPAGALTSLALAYRLLDPPAGAEVRPGAWVGLGCVVALAAAGWLSLRDERAPGRLAGLPDVPVSPAPPG